MTVPAIRDTSPLARGFTVNIAQEANQWRLRVWLEGRPVANELHDTPTACAMRVGALVLDGTVGANLRKAAGVAVAEAVRRNTGGQ